MATITFIVAYVLLMSITIPVMRWMFRAELQEIVDKTVAPVVEFGTRLNDKMEDISLASSPIDFSPSIS